MTNYARIESRSAWLSSEFGESYARRLFGNTIIDALPRYVRGKRKSKLKGKLQWRKCSKGGWVRTGLYGGYGDAQGYVQERGLVGAVIVQVTWGEDDKVLHTKGAWPY